MKLAIILPALNEEMTIGGVLDGIPSRIEGIDAIEKIVVDDGSSDRTSRIALEKGARVERHSENRGVGAAFATGVKAALASGADVIVNMDADGQFDPATIPKLIRPIIEGKADFVTCTRFGDPDLIPEMPRIKFLGNQWMVWIVNAVTGGKFTDVSCGFRAYTRDTALRLNLFGVFTYTQETFLDLARKRSRMAEVPLPVRGTREFGESRVAGSISRYAVRAGSIILFSLRDAKPLHFFGGIGLVVMALGLASASVPFVHWLYDGKTSPFQSLLTGGTLLVIAGLLLMVTALMADMLGRLRQNQEELLYLLKKQAYERTADGPDEKDR